MDVQQYIAEYKSWFYLITVCWTFLEGETFVLLAAAFAANGSLDPYKLGACAWLGSYLGDQCWFFLGRRFGHVLLRWRPEWKHGIDMVHRWLERWDVLFILSFRFIYGIRNFSSAAMGLSELSVARFMSLNFIAAGIWAVVFVSIGYVSGHAMVRVLGAWAQTIELTLLGVFVFFVVAALISSGLRGRRKRRKAHALLRESLEEKSLN